MKSIKSIINEELALLNESFILDNDNFMFKQIITNSIFNNYKKLSTDYDINITQSNITVYWKIKFWLNDYGIENLIVEIDKVEGSYNLEMRDFQSDELINNINKNINEISWNFQTTNVVISAGDSLYIKTVSFDFANNMCVIGF